MKTWKAVIRWSRADEQWGARTRVYTVEARTESAAVTEGRIAFDEDTATKHAGQLTTIDAAWAYETTETP